METILRENPLIGRKTDHQDVRKIAIPHTPFSYLYRVRDEHIEVLRVWDERQR